MEFRSENGWGSEEADWGPKPRRRRGVRGGVWVGKRRITEEKERSEKVDGGSTTIAREGVWLQVHEGTLQFARHVSLLRRKRVATTNNDSRGRKFVMWKDSS
jgi:hypothetical protein